MLLLLMKNTRKVLKEKTFFRKKITQILWLGSFKSNSEFQIQPSWSQPKIWRLFFSNAHFYNFRFNFRRIHIGRVKTSDFSFRVDKKFSEIPRNLFASSIRLLKCAILSQKLEHRGTVLAVYFYFLEQFEASIELGQRKLLDFRRIPRFLAHKLITRKGKDFKSLLCIFLMQRYHFLVMFWCQPSLTCYVNNHYSF